MKQLACWCAMLLAFFGCFRLSNLVPPSKANFDPLKHFKRNDVRFEGDLVLVYFKWSKTNQNSSKVTWVPMAPPQTLDLALNAILIPYSQKLNCLVVLRYFHSVKMIFILGSPL